MEALLVIPIISCVVSGAVAYTVLWMAHSETRKELARYKERFYEAMDCRATAIHIAEAYAEVIESLTSEVEYHQENSKLSVQIAKYAVDHEASASNQLADTQNMLRDTTYHINALNDVICGEREVSEKLSEMLTVDHEVTLYLNRSNQALRARLKELQEKSDDSP